MELSLLQRSKRRWFMRIYRYLRAAYLKDERWRNTEEGQNRLAW